MTKKRSRPARANGPALGNVITAAINPEYSHRSFVEQPEIDLVAILAARSRVHPASIAAQMLAWGLGVRS